MSNYAEVSTLREGFRTGVLDSLDARKKAIRAVRQMVEENEDAMAKALYKDLRRPKQEALTELWTVTLEANTMLKNLESWLKDEYMEKSFLSMLDTTYIQRQPYGVMLIFGAWNYPLSLLFVPLIGALAAGNTVLLKPSEYAPAALALVVELIPKYLDKHVCQVLSGDADFSQKLLSEERFDYIFFTGGCNAGRAVYTAATKNLTPITLELGGKCPSYVDSDVSLPMAAKRIMFSKLMNVGQVCITTDYVLCHEDVLDRFVEVLIKTLSEFLADDPKTSPHIGRIVNEKHFKRLTNLLAKTRGKIICGGDSNAADLFISPTIVTNVPKDDVLMDDEIFGPILPIVVVKSPAEAIEFINSKNKPLALYVFTNDNNVFANFKHGTSSGAISQNDCMTHVLISQLPFGGVGASGIGNYHGRFSVDTFSHKRAVLVKARSDYINEKCFYPPFTENKLSWARWLLSSSESSACNIM